MEHTTDNWENKSDYGSLVREMFKNTDAPTSKLREAYVEGVAKMLHYGVPRQAVFNAFYLLHNLYISHEKSLLSEERERLVRDIREMPEATRDEAYNESIVCRADVLDLLTKDID